MLRLRETRSNLGLDCLGPLHFSQAGCFALKIAKEEQFGSPYARGTHDLNLVDDLGIRGEDALDALTEAHLTHGKAALRAVPSRNHDTLKCLKSLFVAFLDSNLHTDGVAWLELRYVVALQLGCNFCHDR